MDFRQEAENIERFQRFFKDDRRVRAPSVLPQFTSRRVLVMEYISGTKIDRLQEHFRTGRLSFKQVMETLTGVYMRMMMVDGFMHADPHPGNLLVRDDGMLVTRGDANPVEDASPLAPADVEGVVRLVVPLVGRPLMVTRGPRAGDLSWTGLLLGALLLVSLRPPRGRPRRRRPAAVPAPVRDRREFWTGS